MPTFVANSPYHSSPLPISGKLVRLDNELFYEIEGYDRLRPFFMSLVSDSDLWLFVSSKGGLSAGRGTPDRAIFPYYTDDKIHDGAEFTGSKTIIRLRRNSRDLLWEPFSVRTAGLYSRRRTLLKNISGNRLIFREENQDLGLRFAYEWTTCNRFGLVRSAELTNLSTGRVELEILDGVQNLLPSGMDSQFQLGKSTLLDAYKKNELIQPGLASFSLASTPVDRPEPAECLQTTLVWSAGLRAESTLLCDRQIENFRRGMKLATETGIRAERGCYFLSARLRLAKTQTVQWLMAADVNRSTADVLNLGAWLKSHSPAETRRELWGEVKKSQQALQKLVWQADGKQSSADAVGCARHYANTLCNIMRGGVFDRAYQIDGSEFRAFLTSRNQSVAARNRGFASGKEFSLLALLQKARQGSDRQLERLVYEFLPLTFSRRHGDPSRPWNRFALPHLPPDARRAIHYEGNWRDIFQNWEALALSYPAFLPGMVCKFLNASTVDGYNPYRISDAGIDWETADPHDPWSFIGYWGDHQIIYLLNLLESLQAHDPAWLAANLDRSIFVFANVPYRLKSYRELVQDPKNTVIFEEDLDREVREKARVMGGDGKLVLDDRGQVRLVTLAEKLLIPILAKLSNFVPEAGVWLNTQRPEWNDANNALVGNGCSVVTLAYLRRHLVFCRDLFARAGRQALGLSEPLARWLRRSTKVFGKNCHLLRETISSHDRRRILDALGELASEYRTAVYRKPSGARRLRVSPEDISSFFAHALQWVDHSLKSNRRPDDLYHAYNLISFVPLKKGRAGVEIRRLYEMLEGQVAILTSGFLQPAAALENLLSLRQSRMYRPDQSSYLLYPDRELLRFDEKNRIPARAAADIPLLGRLVRANNSDLIQRDATGALHFTGTIRNGTDVEKVLSQLSGAGFRREVRRDGAKVLALFERIFDHQSFTGRSGAFFGYEGLGCIYWHMVSKLALAAQQCFFRAVDSAAPPKVIAGLAAAYHDIRSGLGDHKTPAEYGAFPIDPYSHTPAQGGARQPGLTGQVKEDILCRFGELGVRIRDGVISFQPALLKLSEFVARPKPFEFLDVQGKLQHLTLPAFSLAFTYCQVPVVFTLRQNYKMEVFTRSYSVRPETRHVPSELSRSIFSRKGNVRQIRVEVRLEDLFH